MSHSDYFQNLPHAKCALPINDQNDHKDRSQQCRSDLAKIEDSCPNHTPC